MKTYQFTVERHEDYGTLGFKPKWYPEGEPLVGMTVAHDILEHFPHDDGKAEGEFLALGAALWIRGNGGLFSNSSPEENIAADLPQVWAHHVYRDRRTSLKPCGVSHDERLMDQCREIVRIAMNEFRHREEEIQPSEENQEGIARWIARGYMKASRRYGRIGACMVAWDLFRPIQEQADRVLKYAEEGMILNVKISLKNRSVKVACDYPADFY